MSTEPNPTTADDDCVVDLAPLAAACSELVAWYDEHLAGNHPAIADLDRIVTTLQALPPVPGRIGRDIQVIVTGGRGSTRHEIIGAVERLRTLASHNLGPALAPPAPKRTRRRRDRRPTSDGPVAQASLPGLDEAG